MIKLADSSIMVIDDNGNMSSFDPEQLQTKLIRSFLAAGVQEIYLAEDIALAVEFALEQSTNDERLFSLSEINATVGKILSETGFHQAANIFSRNNNCIKLVSTAEFDSIAEIIKKHLGLESSSLQNLTNKVILASRKLNIPKASPNLFLELAKYYETEQLVPNSITPVSMTTWEESRHWLVPRDELYCQLNTATQTLVDAKVLRISGVSSMFPSVRLFFMINEFVNFHGLIGTLTEMILIPYLFSAGKAIDNCIKTAENLTKTGIEDNLELPVFLNIPDMSSFATNSLQAFWPEAEKDCREMVSPLCQSLSAPVFKLKLS